MGDKLEKSVASVSNFDEIMDGYGEDVKRLIFTYVKNTSLTDDLVQEVFISVYNHLDQFKGESNLKTWIYRIAINKCKDYLRSPKYHMQKVIETIRRDQFVGTEVGLEKELIKNEESHELINIILKLPVKYREVIFHYYYYDFSTEEIAELLGLNVNTVKTRLTRARERLKKMLEQRGFGQHGV